MRRRCGWNKITVTYNTEKTISLHYFISVKEVLLEQLLVFGFAFQDFFFATQNNKTRANKKCEQDLEGQTIFICQNDVQTMNGDGFVNLEVFCSFTTYCGRQ